MLHKRRAACWFLPALQPSQRPLAATADDVLLLSREGRPLVDGAVRQVTENVIVGTPFVPCVRAGRQIRTVYLIPRGHPFLHKEYHVLRLCPNVKSIPTKSKSDWTVTRRRLPTKPWTPQFQVRIWKVCRFRSFRKVDRDSTRSQLQGFETRGKSLE